MNTTKVTELFIGAGAALSANNTAMASIAVQTGIVGSDMVTLNPAGGDTITTEPTIYLVNKLANSDLKKSFPINGTSVSGWKGKHYKAARPEVWSIGYQRGYCTNPDVAQGTVRTFAAASGSITVANSTIYNFSIRFKWDKSFYSERPEVLNYTFVSAAAATQLTIATQIAAGINNSAFGSSVTGIKCVKALVIGDGTGVAGLTGATNYGVEIWGLDVNQFQNTSYQNPLVYFSVHVDDSTGFDTTACTNIQTHSIGTGTYNQIYNMENYNYQFEGVLNRTKWPIPTLAFLASSTYVTSGSVAAAATLPTGNISAGTISEDTITVTATTGLNPGDAIAINDVAYVIKHIPSATKVVLTTVLAATYTGASLKVKYLYNLLNIELTDVITTPGANVGQFSKKVVLIATPAIDAAAADPFDRTLDSADTSAECLDILDILNAWMTSTPLAPATLTLAV